MNVERKHKDESSPSQTLASYVNSHCKLYEPT